MQVFLSYNREDRDAVEEVARRLRLDGIEPWFDRWSAATGEAWQVQIAEALGTVPACAVFVGPHGLGGWAREELAVAQHRSTRDRDFRLFMVLLPGAAEPHDPVLAFLNQRTWVDLREGIWTEEGHRDLLRAITGPPRDEDGIEPDPAGYQLVLDPKRLDAHRVERPAAGDGKRDARERPSLAAAPGELPTGVVTFLLTDIEGSSRLWEADGRRDTRSRRDPARGLRDHR